MDFLFLVETWLSPRLSSRGRRLAVIFRNCFHCLTVSTETFPSFELNITKIDQSKPFCYNLLFLFFICHLFLSDLNMFLSTVLKFDKVLLIGDFNIHVDDTSSRIVSDFLHIIEPFSFSQHISGLTYTSAHTLNFPILSFLTWSNYWQCSPGGLPCQWSQVCAVWCSLFPVI